MGSACKKVGKINIKMIQDFTKTNEIEITKKKSTCDYLTNYENEFSRKSNITLNLISFKTYNLLKSKQKSIKLINKLNFKHNSSEIYQIFLEIWNYIIINTRIVLKNKYFIYFEIFKLIDDFYHEFIKNKLLENESEKKIIFSNEENRKCLLELLSLVTELFHFMYFLKEESINLIFNEGIWWMPDNNSKYFNFLKYSLAKNIQFLLCDVY